MQLVSPNASGYAGAIAPTTNPKSDRYFIDGDRYFIDGVLPQEKKPGFLDKFCLSGKILCKNPVSELRRDRAPTKPKSDRYFIDGVLLQEKKPGFLDKACL